MGKAICIFHAYWLDDSNLNIIRLKFLNKAFCLIIKPFMTHYQKALIFKSLAVKMWGGFDFSHT